MSFKTVCVGIIIEDEISSLSAIEYAVALCDRERAHLSCQIAAPLLDLPTGRILPLVHALVDQVNADRLAKANEALSRVETSCRLAGVPLACQILQKPYSEVRAALTSAVRASDLVILPRPKGVLSTEEGLGEGVLFDSGRPVICVPPEWSKEPEFRRIVVAWDGSARAARAVGDAMGFLRQADEVEIVSVTPDGDKNVEGAELAEHLSRHCRNLKLIDLPMVHGDAGWTLRDHVDLVKPALLVMGAYAHSRLFQLVVGGVTSLMLNVATVPVLYSY